MGLDAGHPFGKLPVDAKLSAADSIDNSLMNLGAAQAGRQRAGVNRYSTGLVSDLQAASTYLWQAKMESVLAPGLAKSYSVAPHSYWARSFNWLPMQAVRIDMSVACGGRLMLPGELR
jgi:hypothetical protein